MRHMKRKGFRFSTVRKITRRTHANAPPRASFYLRGGGLRHACERGYGRLPLLTVQSFHADSQHAFPFVGSNIPNPIIPRKSAATASGWAGTALSIEPPDATRPRRPTRPPWQLYESIIRRPDASVRQVRRHHRSDSLAWNPFQGTCTCKSACSESRPQP